MLINLPWSLVFLMFWFCIHVLRVGGVSLGAVHSVCATHHLSTVSWVWIWLLLLWAVNRSSLRIGSWFAAVNLVGINSSSGVLHWLLSILALASSSLAISVSLRSFYLLVVVILRMLMQFGIWMTDTLANLVLQLHISLVLFLFLIFNLFLVLLNSSLICQVSEGISTQVWFSISLKVLFSFWWLFGENGFTAASGSATAALATWTWEPKDGSK